MSSKISPAVCLKKVSRPRAREGESQSPQEEFGGIPKGNGTENQDRVLKKGSCTERTPRSAEDAPQ